MKKLYLLAVSLLTLSLLLSGCGNSDDGPSVPPLADGDVVSFTLLQTTDVHHRALGTGASATHGTENDLTEGSYSRLATKIWEIRQTNTGNDTPTVLVDSGDYLMGTVYDMTLGGVPAAMAFFQLMEYDAITFGNHEFDYGPGPLAMFLNNAIADGSNFNVPVVASNMVTSISDSGDNELEYLVNRGYIRDTLLLTLSNRLRVGIIGLIGEDAENDAPLASPVTFTNNMSDPDEVAFIQAKVDYLKRMGANVIVALSHSGVTNPNDPATRSGDDIALANAVTGIDIIASGHEHEMTNTVIDVGNPSNTKIICAGNYGTNLAQLNITFTMGTGVTETSYINHAIDPGIEQDPQIQFMVGLIDFGINEAVSAAGIPEINTPIATTDSTNLSKPFAASESGMGNLVADSLRFINYAVEAAVDSTVPPETAVGVVANGVVRNGFFQGQPISFADLYSVLPLGMTIDTDQQGIPGYPLMKVYLTGQEIVNMAQLISYVIGAGEFSADPVTIGGILQTKYQDYTEIAAQLCVPETEAVAAARLNNLYTDGDLLFAGRALSTYSAGDCAGAVKILSQGVQLSGGLVSEILPQLDAEYFMNSSGINFARYDVNNLFQVQFVGLYAANDFICKESTGPITPIYKIDGSVTPDPDTVYPVIIDLYAFLIMQSETIDALITALGIPIVPRSADGTPIFTDSQGNPRLLNTSSNADKITLLTYRLDQNPSDTDIQEVKEWQALLTFVTDPSALESNIPHAIYGTTDRITAVQVAP